MTYHVALADDSAIRVQSREYGSLEDEGPETLP